MCNELVVSVLLMEPVCVRVGVCGPQLVTMG